MDIYVKSSKEALSKCFELLNSGKAELFRGQTNDWPVIQPSLFRLSGDEYFKAEKELKNYLNWAYSVSQMNQYQHSEKWLIAIAQHYGIHTNLLDLTTSPEIALLFSKVEDDLIDSSSQSVIYCFSKSKLNEINNGSLIELNVDNLFRLEAQSGLFLEFLNKTLATELKSMAIRIHFPSEKLNALEHKLIYPEQKSHLEIIIDQWLYRREIEQLQKLFSDVPIKLKTNRNKSYSGVFMWRNIPDISPEWMNNDWTSTPVESFSNLQITNKIIISKIKYTNFQEIIDFISEKIRNPIKTYFTTGQGIYILIEIPEIKITMCQMISKILNRCWDGIRILPYTEKEMIRCIALTASFLLARTLQLDNINDLPQQLWGESELLEIAPNGGHIDAGLVSRADLEKSFSNKYYGDLTKYFRNEIKKSPILLMKWVLQPWIIFDFIKFKKIYIEQFIPTSIDEHWKSILLNNETTVDNLWATSFNPMFAGYVTNSQYRFFSPIAAEVNLDQIIFIGPKMKKIDIEETFIHCLPKILNGGEPFQVRFIDYENDKRELWEISRVIKQCQWIIEVSGISVLEVIISKEETIGPKALGAFDIWIIANKLVEKAANMNIFEEKQHFDEFYKRLLYSNGDLEKRMKCWVDTLTSHT